VSESGQQYRTKLKITVGRGEVTSSPFAAVEPRLKVLPNGCWEWTGARANTGYGVVTWRYKTLYVHRVVYEHYKGPVPESLELDHLCRNRACANPDHLEAVARVENTRRGNHPSSVIARSGMCSKGHPMTPENTMFVRTRPGRRICRECKRERDRRWSHRKQQQN
jgi:hypothetical protein